MSHKILKLYILRLTGKEITLIVAALAASSLPGATQLAQKVLNRVVGGK